MIAVACSFAKYIYKKIPVEHQDGIVEIILRKKKRLYYSLIKKTFAAVSQKK